ncbi:hypothetical protein SELMODRAFT_413504 [Selaginella moellendorffii]|uniref:Uncharacterized protein n=1 Tax=Selaginella moellendorffii TaxID=88036 RepID=D8RPP6_SELML|nr:hypothetical protein SELMODRAFT_413504 [Selaginella moellendorffii]
MSAATFFLASMSIDLRAASTSVYDATQRNYALPPNVYYDVKARLYVAYVPKEIMSKRDWMDEEIEMGRSVLTCKSQQHQRVHLPSYERPNKNTRLAGSDDFELDPTSSCLSGTTSRNISKASAEVGDVRLTAESLSRHFLSKQVVVLFLAMEHGDNDEQIRGVDTSTLKSSCWRTCEG